MYLFILWNKTIKRVLYRTLPNSPFTVIKALLCTLHTFLLKYKTIIDLSGFLYQQQTFIFKC